MQTSIFAISKHLFLLFTLINLTLPQELPNNFGEKLLGYITPQINGLGLFLSNVSTGIYGVSLSGGAEVLYLGQGMSHMPSDFTVLFSSSQIGFSGEGPPLSQDNAFNSHTDYGKLQYTLPSAMDLMGISYEDLNAYDYITFDTSLSDMDSMNSFIKPLNCVNKAYCRIVMSRSFTPTLYYLSPPVVYLGSEVGFWVDPKSVQNYKDTTEWPFTEARIDSQTIDFNDYIDETITLWGYSKNQVRGLVGQIHPKQSASVNMKFKAGNALHYDASMLHCSYDNQTCYKAKAVAVIKSISASQGYTSGGQLITVKGFGFDHSNINAVIDGVQCEVQTYSQEQFTCKTGANSAPSSDAYFIGQHGLRRKIFNTTTSLSFNSLLQSPTSEQLAMTLEAQVNYKDGYYGNVFSGYFKAPATANYRFYMSCDDVCTLSLSNVNKDPSSKQTIIKQASWTSYRNYFTSDNSRNSDWIPLTQDNYYFIEALHVQSGGGDHLAVSVEIDQSPVTGHQHSMREIQKLTIDQTLVREQSTITILNPDGGNYVLNILTPATQKYYTTVPISTKATNYTLYYAVKDFYYNNYGASIRVDLVMYDANDAVTVVAASAVKYVYTINVLKSLATPSTNVVSVTKVSTTSTVTFTIPKSVQLSNLPLSGNFQIQCTLADGTKNQTVEISVKAAAYTIKDKIILACPNYKEKIEVWDGSKYYYIEDGREIMIRFMGFNKDVPQMDIFSGIVTPLGGNNVGTTSSTLIPYNGNLFYEPIPFDFIYTNETKPQVIVDVDGIEAVCASLNCNYEYIVPTSSISGFSLSSRTLTITGTNLPTSDLQSITFSNVKCTPTSTSSTQITCTLSTDAVSGEWAPQVTDSFGLIPLSTTSKTTIPVTVNTITPQSNLNPFGETKLTITGSNFPPKLKEGNTLSVSFSDGSQCNIVDTTSSAITCTTNEFATGLTSATVTVSINGLVDSTLTVGISSAPAAISDIIPNKASPVLKSQLQLKVTGFSGTLVKEDLSVKLISSTNSSYVKLLNVIAVDNANKVITVKFGGAYSGQFKLIVVSDTYGKFDTSAVSFEAVGKVTEYTPKAGSIYGGTLITITGYNFSTDITDNPIRVGQTDCLVQTSSNNQITCRAKAKVQDQIEGQEIFLVFLKTSEEAVCTVSAQCMYNWVKNGLPTLSSYTVNFDTTLNDFIITFTGTGFGATTSNTVVNIDGVPQTVIAASDTEVQVKIIDIASSTSKNIDFFLPIGVPEGAQQLATAGISLTPQFISVSPSEGSSAGSWITATVKGVGTSSTGVTLLTSAGVDICSKVDIPSYGVVRCKTKATTIASGTLKVKVGTSTYSCVGTCTYGTSSSKPSVSGVNIESDKITITFAGLNLAMSGFNAKSTYAGVFADIVTKVSDTQVTAIWNYGIPLSSSAISPELYFESTGSNETHWASITATVSNSAIATSIDSTVQCSFAGGCQLSISQPGLYSTLLNDANSITVCGQKCSLSTIDSTQSITKCTIPSLATTYSVQHYNIIGENYIYGSPFSSNNQYTYNIFDGDNQYGFQDTAANCYFGTAFKTGFIGLLREVKYFMNRFVKATYVGKLRFEGSMDGVTYTTIFTVGQEIHEGWNYYSYPQGSELKYRFYRFYGAGAGSCVVGEIGFRGFEVIDNSASSYTCSAAINLNGTSTALTGSVTYTSTLTPLLTSISPRFGSVKGNEEITFTGTNFSPNMADYSIKLDGIVCQVTAASNTYVKCTTGSRPGQYLKDPSMELKVNGYGKIATNYLMFRYVNYWSEDTTWGGEYAPMDGESVWIPKGLHLLVDVDATAVLQAVIVEGSLLFAPDSDPNHQRSFDAHYIMIKGGYMEVGTEQFPYTSKLTITMHGTKQSPEIPIYGNKVIAVRNGILDLHGVPRNPVWTMLDTTVQAGSSQITLMQAIDWKAGEKIVIAPTGYDCNEAEVRFITNVDRTNPSKPVVTLDEPLKFKHYAAIEYYGTDFIEMRAEVGLLTRNVVYRGDPETSSKNQFGAHIMMHSHGDESLIGRIEYIEFTDVGQAFQLGRYPIHYHLIGTVHYSYARGNAIYNTYNRAVTIHNVHYLRVQNNVAFNTMGHTFFIEDAVETKTLIENNLAILTKISWSLLNTDQTPASFWITMPDNIFRGNHAAGGERYGFWFDTQVHSTGPSYDPNVCPEYTPLGEFSNNVAHTYNIYGLRIFHKLIPRLYPCMEAVYDKNNLTDPYWQNPLITAEFVNFTAWKNRMNGAIAHQVGDVRFKNFKVADNLVCGIEFSMTKDALEGTAQIDGALVIGYSGNAEPMTMNSDQHGIITARTEFFEVHNIKFYNFDKNNMSAIGSCSHCFGSSSTDSGARTTTFSGLYFDATVHKKIRYQFPYRDIFYDLDGSLTGLGPKTWASPYFPHNDQPECQYDSSIEDIYNGLLCDSTVQVRRLVFYNYEPDIFFVMEMKVLKYDDTIVGGLNDLQKQDYIKNTSAYSIVPFKVKLDPMNSWAVPYITGHKYKIHWRNGLDFTKMQVDLSPKWKATDKNVYLILNFTDVRAKIDVITGSQNISNATLLTKSNSLWQTGDNVCYNDTPVRELHLLFNGKNITKRDLVSLVAYRCIGSCLAAVNDTVVEDNFRRWSDPGSWDTGKVPVAGEDVEVKSGWNMLYDVAESPIINMLQINGRLTFEQGKDLNLRAKYIFVRAGELIIGDKDAPFTSQAKITLYGEKQNMHIVYDNAIEAGNKLIANTGKIQIYGQKRIAMSRLRKTAYPSEQTITVEPGLSWQAGDMIGIAPTTLHFEEADTAVIASYDNATGVIMLDRVLTYYHYGASQSTAAQYSGVDIRAEVAMLTRNVKISGEDVESWGCQIVTSDFVEVDGSIRYGQTVLDGVEIYNCSQYDTEKAALRWENAQGRWSSVTSSTIHHGLGWGSEITSSSNVLLRNNIFFSFIKVGININTATNITLDKNYVIRVHFRADVIQWDKAIDRGAGIASCVWIDDDVCTDVRISNNVVAGTYYTGYSVWGQECGDYKTVVFTNNTAHSINGTGAIISPNNTSPTQQKCMEASSYTAYKCTFDGAITYRPTEKAVFSNMVFIDNAYSGQVMIGQEGDNLKAEMRNIKFYGESEARDCPQQNYCVGKELGKDGCFDRIGLILSSFTQAPKPQLPITQKLLPIHKIKSDAAFGGDTYYENLHFINFKSTQTYCGNSQTAIGINEYATDYIPRVKFYNTKFENVDNDVLTYIYAPKQEWASVDFCGSYPCTGPFNILMQFEKTSYTGSITPVRTDSYFSIIPNNVLAFNGYSGCKVVKAWNANFCTNQNLAMLIFDSLDGDPRGRTISPIYVENNQINSLNTINQFSDHACDDFYRSQKRLQRWPTLLQIGQGVSYNISYTSTPPGSQRFRLIAESSGVTIRIKFPKAGTYQVQDSNGKLYEANAWDDKIKQPGLIKERQCGENRFIGVENILEMYLNGGCTLYVIPINSIQSSVRLNWTLDQFYADGGTTKFVDRMAGSLGIHASDIKIVSVYAGSVIVNFAITDPKNSTTVLASVKSKLKTQIEGGKMWLGAPILSAAVSSVPVSIKGTTTTNPSNGGNTGTPTTTPIGTNTTNGGTNTGVITNQTNSKDTKQTSTQVQIINETDQNDDQQHQKVLIIVICVIIGLILIAAIVAYIIYRKCKNSSSEKKTVQSSPEINANSPGPAEETYEPQYHPKAEIGNIFGVNDIKIKINNADDVINESKGGETEQEESKDGDQQFNTNMSNLEQQELKEETPLSSMVSGNRRELAFKAQSMISMRVEDVDQDDNIQNTMQKKIASNQLF